MVPKLIKNNLLHTCLRSAGLAQWLTCINQNGAAVQLENAPNNQPVLFISKRRITSASSELGDYKTQSYPSDVSVI